MELVLGSGITVVNGRNGQGKTNLLEAIHWVTQGWSPRARSLEFAVQWKCTEAWLRMEGTASGGLPHRQALLWRNGSSTSKVAETENRGLAALHGHVRAVMMGPEDIALVREGPEHRRRWIDLLLTGRFPEGLDLLMRYRRILAQRNRWLKDHRGHPAPLNEADRATLDSLTAELARLGAAVIVRRNFLLEELRPLLVELNAQLACGGEMLDVEYVSGVNLSGDASMEQEPGIAEVLLRKLQGVRSWELLQGVTGTGPHRDDIAIRFAGSGANLREAGSQGQCRTAALALGMTALHEAAGLDSEPPILLLDDIFAELDAERRSALAGLIRSQNCQVLIATPRAKDLPFSCDAQVLVENGVAVRSGSAGLG